MLQGEPAHPQFLGLGIGLLIFLSMLGIGLRLVRWGLGGTAVGGVFADSSSGSPPSLVGWVPTAAALGFGVWSFAGFALAMAMAAPLSASSAIGLIIIGIAMGGGCWIELARSSIGAIRDARVATLRDGWLALACLLTMAVLLTLATINSLTPPREGDTLQGYLFTARWIAHHGLEFCPYNPRYSLMPFNTEVVHALAYSLGAEPACSGLDHLLTMMFLLGIQTLASTWSSSSYAWLAMMGLVTTTEFMSNWSNGKIDALAGFIVFEAAALPLIAGRSRTPRIMGLAAFLLGVGCAMKYSVWILAIGLVPWLGWLADTSPSDAGASRVIWRTCRRAGGIGVIVLACLIPHITKNLAWTGNPIAPFGGWLFPSRNIAMGHVSDARVWELGDVPWLIPLLFFQVDETRLGPWPLLILVGIPLTAWATRKRASPRGVEQAVVGAALMLGAWIAVRRADWDVTRFLFAPLALLIAASSWGVAWFCQDRRIARIAVAIVAIALVWTSAIWPYRHWRESWRFIVGRETAAQWFQRTVPWRGRAALQAVAPKLAADRRLMIGSSLYYLPESALPYASTEREFLEFLETPDPDKLAYLRAQGFGFYYYSRAMTLEWSKGLPVFDEYTPKALGELQFTLYEIPPAPPTPPTSTSTSSREPWRDPRRLTHSHRDRPVRAREGS